MDLEPQQIRARLRFAREQAGLSQREMAVLLGVNKKSVENYEHVRVPFDRLNEWAAHTGTTADWLIFGEASPSVDDQVEAARVALSSVLQELRTARAELNAVREQTRRLKDRILRLEAH